MKWHCKAPLGSKEWIDDVYASPPARDPRGRSRPTQRASPPSSALRRSVGIEGGNELTAYLVLEILFAAGLIKRFKEQPFALDRKLYGSAAIPDFIFEWYDGQHFVAEVKSSAYYTAAKERTAEKLHELLGKHQLKYVVWTTEAHLTRRLWHNVRQIRRRHLKIPEPIQLDALLRELEQGPKSLGLLIDQGYEQDEILCAIWSGQLHINLLEKRDVTTKVHRYPNPHFYTPLLGARPDTESWWNALSDH
jgi:hypothetical protein